ncbi:MAG: NAD(P)-binding domain-containing protein [Burkholderiales bacterium]
MKVGFVGVRDARIALQFASAGVEVFATSACADGARIVVVENAVVVAQALVAPRVIFLDLPDGFATELAMADVWPECEAGDVVIDLGAGTPDDARRRAAALASVRMHFVDGYASGQGLALGGSEDAVRVAARYLDLAGAWTHRGPSGSGYHARLDTGDVA